MAVFLFRFIVAIFSFLPVFAYADFGRPAVYILNGVTYPNPAAACKALDPSYPHAMGLAPSSSSAETDMATFCRRVDFDSGAQTSIGNYCPTIPDRVRLQRTPAPIVGNGVALTADTCNYSGKDPNPGPGSPDDICGNTFKYAGWHVGGEYTDFVHISGKIEHGAQFCVPFEAAGQGKGCRVEFDLTSQYQNDDKSWSSYGKLNPVEKIGGGSISGQACTPAETKPPGDGETPKPDKAKCENGYQGEVNGVATCVPNVKDNGVDLGGDKKTETKPDGTKNETTTKTECSGGKCTTTTTVTTTTPGGGSSTQVTKIEQPEKEFCASNPTKCQGGKADTGTGGKGSSSGNGNGGDGKDSKFGGSCAAGFTCEGDALQCAIAREQHKRNCELYEKDTDPGSLTNRALNGSDDKSADAMKANAQQVAVGTFDQAGLGWSSSCPADPSIPLNFGGISSEFTIPFSRICGPLGILSMAGVGITLLGCMVWVLGGNKSA